LQQVHELYADHVDSVNIAFHTTPAQALRIHHTLHSRHLLTVHFAMFVGRDVEASDLPEQAKCEMACRTGPQASKAETRRAGRKEGEREPAGTVGSWRGTGAGPQVSEAKGWRVDRKVREMESGQ